MGLRHTSAGPGSGGGDVFGTTQIAANAIANNLDGMGVLPGQAMNLAMITVVGRCWGRRF